MRPALPERSVCSTLSMLLGVEEELHDGVGLKFGMVHTKIVHNPEEQRA